LIEPCGQLDQIVPVMLQALTVLRPCNTYNILYIFKFVSDLEEGIRRGLQILKASDNLFGMFIIIPKPGSRYLRFKLNYLLMLAIDVKDNLLGYPASLRKS